VVKENTMKNILGTTKNLTLFDKDGRLLYNFYKGSDGYSYERTCDSNGNVLTFKDSNGYSSEYTYDLNGNELTYKDSTGFTRGFDIPEYTMEELVEKLGNFKIKK
jgi:YD repeat-containing protein